MMKWYWRKFDDLSRDELYAVLALRQDVFIFEQRSIYRDLDFCDQDAMHLLGVQDQQLVTYARLLSQGVAYADSFSIGRVVTAKVARGQGFGKKAMKRALAYFKKIDDKIAIRLSAQLQLVKFYESFGFHTEGEAYDDGGVPHVDMCS